MRTTLTIAGLLGALMIGGAAEAEAQPFTGRYGGDVLIDARQQVFLAQNSVARFEQAELQANHAWNRYQRNPNRRNLMRAQRLTTIAEDAHQDAHRITKHAKGITQRAVRVTRRQLRNITTNWTCTDPTYYQRRFRQAKRLNARAAALVDFHNCGGPVVQPVPITVPRPIVKPGPRPLPGPDFGWNGRPGRFGGGFGPGRRFAHNH